MSTSKRISTPVPTSLGGISGLLACSRSRMQYSGRVANPPLSLPRVPASLDPSGRIDRLRWSADLDTHADFHRVPASRRVGSFAPAPEPSQQGMVA